MSRLLTLLITVIIPSLFYGQLFVNTDMGVLSGGIVKVQNNSLKTGTNGNLENAGAVSVDYDFINNGLSTGFLANTGVYTIGGNWENNGLFNAGNSIVHLYNADKLITGNSVTDFFRLRLTGGKKLMTIDASASWLDLGIEHLLTGNSVMFVDNPDPLSLIYTSGFISSRGDGHLQRRTNTTQTYTFPLGTDLGTFRMRPLAITPKDNDNNVFGARLANNNATEDGYSLTDKSALVGNLNPLYYHHIYHPEGNSFSDLLFYYDPNEDEVTETIGHWSYNWLTLDNVTTGGTIGSFSTLLLPNYNNFNDRPFILASERDFIYIPNTFTPNNDGVNDLFKVSFDEEQVVNFSFIVFDRWGAIVFQENQPNFSWDGVHKGEVVPDGAYIWKMNYQLKGKKQLIEQVGHVLVLK